VQRDGNGRVQTVTFEALGKVQPDGSREILSIIWRSDHSEIAWVESFTKELLKKEEKLE
jgi:transposase-like protein